MERSNTLERLAAGLAFVDASSWRTVTVSGSDAIGWLNDLVSARVEDLTTGRARRSLLLSPTGGVLAEFTVAILDDRAILIQDPRQPRSIAELLEPYVLSSDVRIEDRSGGYTIFALPGREAAPGLPGTESWTPSCLGAGIDVVAPAPDHDRVAGSLGETFTEATEDDAEALRILSAIPRVGVDTADGDLPLECGLDEAVSRYKGCFLGQEAVARMRNLGHPRRWVITVEADGELTPGDPVIAGEDETGVITSVARADGVSLAFARIRWAHRDRPLRTAAGVELRPRSADPSADGASRSGARTTR